MARIKSIKKIGKRPVYNMFVEGTHNFLIQGNVISHNCDALRYFAIYWTMGAHNDMNDKRIKWREDMWEDYENASASDKQMLIERWGRPN